MTTPKAQQTSLRIFKAAAELFDKYGYYNVSIKEIADRAKSNSALISHYFGGKEKLYQQIITMQAEDLSTLQHEINEQGGSALSKLYDYLTAIMQRHLDPGHHVSLLYREMLTSTGLCDEYIGEQLKSIHDFTVHLLKEAIAEKAIKPLPEPAYAAFILESITVLIFLARKQIEILNTKEQDEEKLMHSIIHSYFANLLLPKEENK